jgi:multidrug transporter EmrE-like cation transporter
MYLWIFQSVKKSIFLLNTIYTMLPITFIVLILLTAIESGAMYQLKTFSLTNNIVHYGLGIFLYSLSATLLMISFNFEEIGIINHSWNIFSSIFGFALGYIVFKETLTKAEGIGVIISLIGLILMNSNGFRN